MRVVDRPTLAPGPYQPATCTDRSSNEPCVDTHQDDPYKPPGDGGRVYLSRRTVREAAETGILTERDLEAVLAAYPGALTAAEASEKDTRIIGLESRVRELETENAEWAPVIAQFEKTAAKWGDD